MKISCFSCLLPSMAWRSRRGSALLITLAFVILLTVVVLGFLSRTLVEQRISANSANQVKADLFAQGVEALIIGDLEAEIQANSVSVSTTGGNIYLPKLNATYNTPAMVPALDLDTTDYASLATPPATLVNLLKISNPNPASGSTFPAAAAALTTTASLNGRSIPLTRWAATTTGGTASTTTGPQLTDPSVAATGSSAFPTPRWVVLTRGGSTPTTWNGNLTYSKTASTTVVGRYAYAIYDEGGLLDMNAAGRPTLTTLPTSLTSNPVGEGFADLTQLTSGASQILTNQQIDTLIGWRNYASLQANGAAAPSGYVNVPAYLSAANATNYFAYVVGQANPTGFLKVATATIPAGKTFTDQAFTSRIELIQFLQSLLAGTTSPTAATNKTANKALQYMTHFSRGLNQPSYVPPLNDPRITTGSPPVTVVPSAGNTGTNTASGNDNLINPGFLTYAGGNTTKTPVRVQTAFTRNDGSLANVGDPLVKKRFDLNRLTWLTYEGPMAGPDGNIGSFNPAAPATPLASGSYNQDIVKMAGYLENPPYNIPASFLQQGTPANIYKYFGLSYVQDERTYTTAAATPVTYYTGDGQYKWIYDHSNSNSTGPFTAGFGTATYPIPTAAKPIARLTDIAAYAGASTSSTAPREPDFFELLKAADACGSKAKPATIQSTASPVTAIYQPDDYQAKMDGSLEFAVIQMGVNIIDQSKLDGYPTRILFCDGSLLPKEFRGVQNLPYIYRIRSSGMQEAAPIISSPGYVTNNVTSGAPVAQPLYNINNVGFNAGSNIIGGTITKVGCNVMLDEPEIWNPYDQNSPRCAVDSSGNYLKDNAGNPLFPTSFRLAAESIDPDHIFVSTTLPTPTGQTQASGVPTASYLYTTCGYTEINNGNFGEFSNGGLGITNGGNFPQTGLSQAPTSGGPYTSLPEGPFPAGYNFRFPAFPFTSESTALTFTIDETASTGATGAAAFFREPTLLVTPNVPAGSKLAPGGSANILASNSTFASTTIPKGVATTDADVQNVLTAVGTTYAVPTVYNTNTSSTTQTAPPLTGPSMIGIYRNCMPAAYYVQAVQTLSNTTQAPSPDGWGILVPRLWDPANPSDAAHQYEATYRIQYELTPGSKNWRTYDEKMALPPGSSGFPNYLNAPWAGSNNFNFVLGQYDNPYIDYGYVVAYDPRTSRFCLPYIPARINQGIAGGGGVGGGSPPHNSKPNGSNQGILTITTSATVGGTWANQSMNEVPSMMPDATTGYTALTLNTGGVWSQYSGNQFPAAVGWFPSVHVNYNPPDPNNINWTDGMSNTALSPKIGPYSLNLYSSAANSIYYQDPDGIVRRAMGANASGTVVGMPMAETVIAGTAQANQTQSRPIILHRPFRSVAELGYVFSGTPWKNLDFFNSESGDSALLDIFTVGDTPDTSGLVAGRINLNTQQIPVLQAIIAGTYKDEQNNYTTTAGNFTPPTANSVTTLASASGGTSGEANAIATALTARTLSTNTNNGQGPLQNVSELVGKWVSGYSNTITKQPYNGFTDDLTSTQYTASPIPSVAIQRFHEAAIRGLASAGQTRVWNVMIDVIAQTGRYPSTATTFDQFAVEGEQRYWIHLAIDRLTGQIIDKQVEVVKQ